MSRISMHALNNYMKICQIKKNTNVHNYTCQDKWESDLNCTLVHCGCQYHGIFAMVKNMSKHRLEDRHMASLNYPLIDTFQRSLLNLWLGILTRIVDMATKVLPKQSTMGKTRSKPEKKM